LLAFKNIKKEREKIKKKKEKERKGKVEGPLWFWPSHTSSIKATLQWKNRRGGEIYLGRKMNWPGGWQGGRKQKKKNPNLNPLTHSRPPFLKKNPKRSRHPLKPSWAPLPLRNERAPSLPLKSSPHFPTHKTLPSPAKKPKKQRAAASALPPYFPDLGISSPWTNRPDLSLLHPALPSPCTRENQSFPLPLVLGESKPERNHHTAPYNHQKKASQGHAHTHINLQQRQSLPFPSHGLQLHPTEASRCSSHLRPNTAAAPIVLFPVFSQSHSNTPAPPSAPVSPRPTTINRPTAASLLQQLITEMMRKWEGRLKNSRREQKTETQGCRSPNRGSGGRHRRCRNEGGRGKLLILLSTRPACRRRRV